MIPPRMELKDEPIMNTKVKISASRTILSKAVYRFSELGPANCDHCGR